MSASEVFAYQENKPKIGHQGCPQNDVIHQAGSRLCYAPSATGETKSAPLTREGHKILVDAVCATQAQKRWARIPLSRKASNSD